MRKAALFSRRSLVALGACAAIELWRWVRHRRLAAELARQRTELAPDFDVAAWAAFFSAALRREAAISGARVEKFVSDAFWQAPLTSLARDDVEAWAVMFLTTREEPDGARAAAERAAARRLVDEVERATGVRFAPRRPEGAGRKRPSRAPAPAAARNKRRSKQTPKPKQLRTIIW